MFIILAVLVLSVFTTFYVVSYKTVDNVSITIKYIRREGPFSDSSGYVSLSYDTLVGIDTWSIKLGTSIGDPTFRLIVDSYPIGSVVFGSPGRLDAVSQPLYEAFFTTTDRAAVGAIGDSSPHHFVIVMDAMVSSGIYDEAVTRSTGQTLTF